MNKNHSIQAYASTANDSTHPGFILPLLLGLAGTLVLMVLLFVYIKSNPASRLLKRKVAATIPLWDEEKRVCYKEAVKRNCENQVFLPAGHKIAILNLEQNEGSLRKRSYDKPSVRRESQRRASIE